MATKDKPKSPPKRARGIQKPVHPDGALAKVVGTRPQPRTEITKRLWLYIKNHHLQDPEDGRVVHPDATLRNVLGGKRKVSMFEIPRHLNAHVH
jgi:chromatin remodeling complex protein RSC6